MGDAAGMAVWPMGAEGRRMKRLSRVELGEQVPVAPAYIMTHPKAMERALTNMRMQRESTAGRVGSVREHYTGNASKNRSDGHARWNLA